MDDVKGIMSQNIEKVLARGERLDELLDKTTDLEAHVSMINTAPSGQSDGQVVISHCRLPALIGKCRFLARIRKLGAQNWR